MSITREDIVEAIKEMNVLEVSELVIEIENTFGIIVTSPVSNVIVDTDSSNIIEEEEQTDFSVTIQEVTGSRVKVVQAIRKINNSLGLKEAKECIDNLPYVVAEYISKEDATEMYNKLEMVGAVVQID